VFEAYTEDARQAVVMAHEEAQALSSAEIGTGHLLLGVVRALPLLLPLRADDVRARLGGGESGGEGQLPFTDAARRVLEQAPVATRRLGHEHVAPGHLLMALSADPAVISLSGLDPARLRDEALRHLVDVPARFDLATAVRDGGPVPVWLGHRDVPIGDLGHPRVDAAVLLAILGLGGGGAALLREHGLDEATVRSALGGP
jgi:hypothetical protein